MTEALGLIIFVAMALGLFIGFGGIAKAREAWSKALFFVKWVAKERPLETLVLAMLLIVCTAYGGTKPEPPDEPDEPDEPTPLDTKVKIIFVGRRADGLLSPYGAPLFIITNTLEEVEE